jgi:aspartate-semialdehyde dehydrogenase
MDMSQKKLRVAVLGATGMVGQRFLALLENHPWFDVAVVAASTRSSGQTYAEAVKDRWALASPLPAAFASLPVQDASEVASIAPGVDFVFCAVDMPKDATARLEEAYARAETPVVSNNSAHRATPDVPMMIPEINAGHADVIPCTEPLLSAQCIRVPVTDGHLATVFIAFERHPAREEILSRWRDFAGPPQRFDLPSAPKPFLTYFDDDTRPQTRLDRDLGSGMGVSVGRLRTDSIFDYRFVALSHNTVRGAAGGAVLTAELLTHEGYITAK